MGNMTVQVKRHNQEINVNITDMDNLEIMKFLRDILNGDTKVLNVPITQPLKVTQDGIKTSVEYPTSKNLTEPTERNEPTQEVPKGTLVMCDVQCPDCGCKYEREAKARGIVSCNSCMNTLFVEPGMNGRYKAVDVFKAKR